MDAGAQPIGALSGDQFRHLLVAFALVGEPNVLILDEPTAGLDEPGQERLNELVASWLALWLQRETGPVIVTLATGCFLVTFPSSPLIGRIRGEGFGRVGRSTAAAVGIPSPLPDVQCVSRQE